MADPIQLSDFSHPLSVEDTVSLDESAIADGSSVQFVLESAPVVTWWKALELHAPDDHIIRSVETQDANHGPQSMSASATELRGARLVLAKAKIFGIHTGMYELRNLDTELGNNLHFVWETDVDSDGALAGFFRDLGRGIDAGANAIADGVETIFNAIGDFIADVIEIIGHVIAIIFDAIGTFLGQIPLIGPALRAVFHWLATIISAAFDLVATVVKGWLNMLAYAVGGIVRIIGGALGGLLAWDSGLVGKSVLRGLADIGIGLAGAIILIFAKILAWYQSIVAMQYGERQLTKDERDMLWHVYRGSVAYWNIRVVDGLAGFYSLNPRAFTLGDTIYMKNTPPEDYHDVLVHECCHVWQYQHFGGRYVMEALIGQTADGYNWRAAIAGGITRWQDLNREGQAQFIQETWLEGRQTATPTPEIGNGVFFADDPIGPDVEFDADHTSFTSFAIEAITYIRSLVTTRLTAGS